MRITVANLKGGTAKTTSSVYLALALGGRTLLVDADPQGSALRWSEHAGASFGVPVVALPVGDLDRRIPELAQSYDHVVIDTPPGSLPIVRSAVMAADRVVIPLSPSHLEFDRLAPTLRLLAEVEAFRPQLEAYVLLVRTKPATLTYRAAAARLQQLGMPILAAIVPAREEIIRAFGTAPSHQAYTAAAGELVA